jgi:hypothetical protein
MKEEHEFYPEDYLENYPDDVTDENATMRLLGEISEQKTEPHARSVSS